MSFDVDDDSQEEIHRTFERWAQHVLVGAKATDGPEKSGEPAGPKRDWAAVRRFVIAHRKREVAYVVKALGDLRNAVFAFTGAFSRVVGEDGKSDLIVKSQLARLEVAAKENNTTAITREALATVALVNDSIERRAQRHSAQLGELVAHVRQLNDQLERAKTAGSTDSLTRVPNRACFDEFLSRTLDLAALSSGAAYLMMVDVDHFKQTNDTFGHGAGDIALKAVADRLSRTFPRRGDLVARYGGDEFAVVLRDLRPDEARLLAERLVVATRATTGEHLGNIVRVSISVGLAPQKEGDTPLTWIARADAALYEAKQAGRDRWAERTV